MEDKEDKIDIVADIIDYEEYLRSKNIADSTIYTYSGALKAFLYANPDITKIDSYNDYIFAHGIKKRRPYIHNVMRLYIKFKFEKDPRQTSLIRNLLKPKQEDPKRIVHHLDDDTREMVISLLKNYKHRLMARIQNSTGVRAGDIIRLKRGTISYEVDEVHDIPVMRIDFVGKGKKQFTKWIYDINTQTQIDLFIKSNLLDTEYYFLERGHRTCNLHMHQFINYKEYWKDLKQALNMAGVQYKDWASHDFRRSFARNVWNDTKDPVVLKEMLNHQQFDTTLRYLRGSGLQSKDVYYGLNERRQEAKKR